TIARSTHNVTYTIVCPCCADPLDRSLLSRHYIHSVRHLLERALVLVTFCALVGPLALPARGIYFLMLTLAFAQVVWSVLSNNQLASVLGGDIGLIGVPRPVLPFAADVNLFRPANFYFLTLTVVTIVYLALAAVVASPFAHTLEGIRENEGRMRAEERRVGK